MRRLPWLRIAGVVLVIGALVQGVALATYLFTNEPERSPALPAPEVAVTDSAAATTSTLPPLPPAAMPLVVGLSVDRAREVLEESGATDVQVETVPWIGDAGVVVGQTPGAGGPVLEGTVTLQASERATTPDLVGLDQTEARNQLAGIGADARFEVSYRPGATPGTVIGQEPAPGDVLPQTVALDIAAEPSQISLTELPRVARDDCSNGDFSSNGVEYPLAIRCLASVPSGPKFVDYDLSRDFELLRAVVGASDDVTDTGVQFVFRVWSADDLVLETMVGFGESELIELDVSDVLRLRLEVELIGPEGLRSSQGAIWGDPILIGDPAAVARIQQ